MDDGILAKANVAAYKKTRTARIMAAKPIDECRRLECHNKIEPGKAWCSECRAKDRERARLRMSNERKRLQVLRAAEKKRKIFAVKFNEADVMEARAAGVKLALMGFFLALTACSVSACSGETFIGFDGGLEKLKPDSGSSTDADSGSDSDDSGGPDRADSSGDSYADANGPCPDPNDVEHAGHCFYLDRSQGVCDQGYVLSSNAKLAAVLAANANAWQGKSYRHNNPPGSICILTKDNVQNYGLVSGASPFISGEPVTGGSGCWMISPPQMGPNQLTLCESL